VGGAALGYSRSDTCVQLVGQRRAPSESGAASARLDHPMRAPQHPWTRGLRSGRPRPWAPGAERPPA